MQREGFGRAALVLGLLLAVLLAVLLVRNQRLEQQRDAAVQAMAEQAEPLEQELARLERELAKAQREGPETVRTAFYAVGYQPAEPADLELIARHAEEYDFTPMLILDPESAQYPAILDAARGRACEMMLTAEPFTDAAADVRRELTETGGAEITAFLLSRTDDSEENLGRVAGAGYTCVARYAESTENALLDNGLVSIGYSRIKSNGFSVKSRLQTAEKDGQTLLFVFDLSALHDGALSEKSITDALTLIFAGRKDTAVQYGTVSEGEQAFRAAEEAHAVSLAELEAYTAEQQQRIDAIRAELDEIYAQWKGKESS